MGADGRADQGLWVPRAGGMGMFPASHHNHANSTAILLQACRYAPTNSLASLHSLSAVASISHTPALRRVCALRMIFWCFPKVTVASACAVVFLWTHRWMAMYTNRAIVSCNTVPFPFRNCNSQRRLSHGLRPLSQGVRRLSQGVRRLCLDAAVVASSSLSTPPGNLHHFHFVPSMRLTRNNKCTRLTAKKPTGDTP